MTLAQAKRYHIQQAAQFAIGSSARKAKRHAKRAKVIELAMKIRREIKQSKEAK